MSIPCLCSRRWRTTRKKPGGAKGAERGLLCHLDHRACLGRGGGPENFWNQVDRTGTWRVRTPRSVMWLPTGFRQVEGRRQETLVWPPWGLPGREALSFPSLCRLSSLREAWITGTRGLRAPRRQAGKWRGSRERRAGGAGGPGGGARRGRRWRRRAEQTAVRPALGPAGAAQTAAPPAPPTPVPALPQPKMRKRSNLLQVVQPGPPRGAQPARGGPPGGRHGVQPRGDP